MSQRVDQPDDMILKRFIGAFVLDHLELRNFSNDIVKDEATVDAP